MIERFEPEISLEVNSEDDHAVMEPDIDGDWVLLDTILDWLKEQRNDIPATGEELANGLAYECGLGKNYFK